MTKWYWTVPVLSCLTGVVALMLVAVVPGPVTGLVFDWRTAMVVAFGLVSGGSLLTLLLRNRFGLYLNALDQVIFIALVMIFGIRSVALLGLAVLAALIVMNWSLIYWLNQRLPFG